MTNEHEGQEPETEQSRPPGMQPEEHDQSAVLKGAGDFTSGEGLVAFAGMVLIAEWLLLGVLADEFWVGWLVLLPATAAVLLPRLNRETVERYHPLPMIMKVLGFWIAVIGVFAVVESLRFAGSSFDEPLDVVGHLVEYAAFAMAFIGARQIKI